LEIIKASPVGVQVSRRTGRDEVVVSKIRFFVNGEEADATEPKSGASLNVLETKAYAVSGIEVGDEIKIAAVLEDGTVCDFADSARAVAG
jgi:hypothetical protein